MVPNNMVISVPNVVRTDGKGTTTAPASPQKQQQQQPDVTPTTKTTTTAASAAQDKDAALSISPDTRRFLHERGFTKGLMAALAHNRAEFALSIWVVDNSGSMNHRDGHRIVFDSSETTTAHLRMESCTRWSEMHQTVEYHAQTAAQLRAPTLFRLLNTQAGLPPQFDVAALRVTPEKLRHDLQVAQSTLRQIKPRGVTPLVDHVHAIHANLLRLEPTLRTNGTRVVVVLATDGMPTDHRGLTNRTVQAEFIQALRTLENLPVWIVVRLCTDEAEVVNFWNELDNQLELSLDVLDDFVSEAEEVHKFNRWLNYGLPLHRIREMGFHSSLTDLLDERKLMHHELLEYCRLLFGDDAVDGSHVPDPQVDWNGFFSRIQTLVDAEDPTWNPVTQKVEPWIDMDRLQEEYGSAGYGWDL